MNTKIVGKETKPQVDAVHRHITSNTKDRDVIKHELLESLINESRKSNRYRTVINSVKRRLLRETGGHLVAVINEGYRRCTGDDQVRAGIGGMGRAVKAMVRQTKVVAAVTDDRVSNDGVKRARDHAVIQSAQLAAAAKQNVKAATLMLSPTNKSESSAALQAKALLGKT